MTDTLDNSGCALHEPFALQVLGPDMEPEFPDRCIVIIDPVNTCRNGMYVFAEVAGVRWLRQYRNDAPAGERLVALNERFPEIPLAGLDWQVLGVVIQRNLRRKIKHYSDDPSRCDPSPSAAPQALDLTGQTG